MKKRLISLIGLIIVIAVAATVMGFALGGGSGDQPVRSDDDIDPNVCNLIHNINACSPEELEVGRALTDETGEGVEFVPGDEFVTSSRPPTIEPQPVPAPR